MEHNRKKIGILGGTFDPIHKGHLNIAQSAYDDFKLDEVWFIPAGHSPNKKDKNISPAKVRLEMTRLAVEDYPYFKVSSIETEYKETSYTYLTLTRLKDQHPDTVFYFIMGADSLDYLEKWYHPEIICQKAIILVAVRDALQLDAIHAKIVELKSLFPAEIYPLSCGNTKAASSEIRQMISNHGDELPVIPDKVKEYILKNHLYERGAFLESFKCK